MVTNATGATIEEESDFYPFGGERVITDLLPDQRYKFTGKERDPESGLDYFGARYYSSNLGRFLTPDWAAAPTAVPYAEFGDPQSLNLYGYVRNNPLSKADPDGHCPPCLEELVEEVVIAHPVETAAVVEATEKAGEAVLAGGSGIAASTIAGPALVTFYLMNPGS